MKRISNTELVCETIRRKRKKSTPLPNGGHEGVRISDIFRVLVPQLMNAEEFTASIRELLTTQRARLSGHKQECRSKASPNNPLWQEGLIDMLHPECVFRGTPLYFSAFGTPIVAKRKIIDSAPLTVVPKQHAGRFYIVRLRSLYLIEDGLPVAIEKLEQKSRINFGPLPSLGDSEPFL